MTTHNNTCNSCGTEKSPKGCKNNGHCATGSCNKLHVFDWLSNIQEPSSMMFPYVEVRFKNDRKDFYHNADALSIKVGDIVATQAQTGHDIGVVTLTGELVRIQMKHKKVNHLNTEKVLKLYRIASQKDINIWQEARDKEYNTMIQTRSIVKNLRLEMKICEVEYQGDKTKVTFYYTADGRVDFRQLIKELASTFKVRIEMRQIGYRQGAAKVGGVGSCGRELCCSTWLTDFRTVNTIAARYQQLSINPQKLAGQCGKLKCCLNYELDAYVESLKNFPDTHVHLQTDKGLASCMKIDIFKQEIWYTYDQNSIVWHKLNVTAANKIILLNKKGEKVSALEDYVVVDESKHELSFENAVEQTSTTEKQASIQKRRTRDNQRKAIPTQESPTQSAEKPRATRNFRKNRNNTKRDGGKTN